ncbi:MAG: stage V sporulation protein AD [Clostridiales bacterium]|nr:stage V sporulation protein AD [Clostridiales bacterium]
MKRTIYFKNKPIIVGAGSIAGPKESEGSIAKFIETKMQDDTFGEDSFEKAESKMLFNAIKTAIQHAKKQENEIDAIIAGDLLNQIISSTFAARNFRTGYLGVYNACATFSEALTVGATMIDGGYLKNVICATSSHFASAERQYRYPLELGCTRPPQAQWTVTGAGACVISSEGYGPKITASTIGKVVDFGVIDANNMGAAMAPAAMDTLFTHFNETGLTPSDYDLIITGDLGTLGSRIFKDLMWEKGFDIEKQHVDCGELIYNICESEYQGGSGAGCSALVFSSYIYKRLKEKKFKKIIMMATGALLSTVSTQQGESIPAIAHAVVVES